MHTSRGALACCCLMLSSFALSLSLSLSRSPPSISLLPVSFPLSACAAAWLVWCSGSLKRNEARGAWDMLSALSCILLHYFWAVAVAVPCCPVAAAVGRGQKGVLSWDLNATMLNADQTQWTLHSVTNIHTFCDPRVLVSQGPSEALLSVRNCLKGTLSG